MLWDRGMQYAKSYNTLKLKIIKYYIFNNYIGQPEVIIIQQLTKVMKIKSLAQSDINKLIDKNIFSPINEKYLYDR